MCSPKITIVTVCYNAVTVIENTILSVINQTYDNIEYIIIDGASTDGTVDIIDKYIDKIAYFVSEPDKGIYDAMNKGIKVATGKWVNFMNAGDSFYDSNSILNIVAEIMAGSKIIYGKTLMRYLNYDIIAKPFPIKDLEWHMAFGHQSSFINLDYHRHHLFNEKYRSSADFDFFHQAYIDNVTFQYVDTIVAIYEASQGISSVNFKLVEKENADILGVNTNFIWYVKLTIRYWWYWIKQIIKANLPQDFVKGVKIRNLEKK